jgi:predicted ATPase/signal transduction histidine kinase
MYFNPKAYSYYTQSKWDVHMSKTDWSPLQKLWEDGEFILSRGVTAGGSEPRLLLVPASDRPSPASIRQLEYLYSLRQKLDSAWFARPLAIGSQDERAALLLEDPGGVLLGQRLARPPELRLTLRIGIGIASALGCLHARGLIHRNLNPDNVFVDLATGEARLVGPYIALRAPGEGFQAPEPIGATLAFLAPEQTGRMNRSTDARSDLYAYGVILYRMVTGVLPFGAKNPTEWIHSHLAVQPIPPDQRSKTVPAQLSAIVMMLLAKMPEERYQTAAGVEKDLRICLERVESGKQIAPFPLGMHDIPDELLISDKLYGRDSQIDALLAAYRRVASDGKPELVLVSGHSGIGKSIVVEQLPNRLATCGGFFASGKFDQHRKDIPYTTVTQAFQKLVHQILSKSDPEVSQWRERLVEALGANGELITNLLPELELIIEKQSPVPNLPPQDAQSRFKITFRRFLGVFAQPEHPLALFLDDLHWADAGTLKLIEHLLTEPELRYVMLIGAYRDNAISASDPLQQTLDKLRNTRVELREIALAPLSLGDMTQLVMDSLHAGTDRAKLLARVIHQKTDGNPFFAIELLKGLAQEKLLVLDPASAAWRWDLEQIRARSFSGNLSELVTDKLGRLSDATLQILKRLACLGSSATMSTISLFSGRSGETLDALVLEAVRAGLVSPSNGSLRFTHDRVQEAAYELIPEADRVSEHLRIGRLLLEHKSPDKIEEAVFEIVSQLNRGVAQVTSAEERAKLVDLNLIAGQRAKATAAYVSALKYLTVASQLLGEDSWRSRYETSFLVTFNIAECELLTGQLDAADQRLSRLSALAENPTDRAAVTSLRVILYTTLGCPERAVEVCLEYLNSVGLACARNPTEQEIAQEYERASLQLRRRAIEELAGLPPMTDPACRGALEVITAIVPPSWFTEENLRNLLVARMVNLSLEYGNSEASCYAYALLARTLGSHFGDYEAGYRFGRLSLELVEKPGLDRFKTRVYACFGHHIDPWQHHLRHSREWLRLACAAAPQAGDLTFAAYNCANTVANLLASGEPLSNAQVEAEKGFEFAQRLANRLAVDLLITQRAYIRALRGLTANLADFSDPEFDEKQFELHLNRDPHLMAVKFRYWVRKLQAHFHAGDYHSAATAAAKVQGFPWRSQSFVELAEYPFYTALALAGLHSAANTAERIRHLDTMVEHQKILSIWARYCPENFACMEALVAAEIARIQGRTLDAERLYEDSLSSARENGFIHNQALANEAAGKFYLERGLQTVAYTYLRNARYCYFRWEALSKVRQIDQKYPDLTDGRMVSLAGEGIDRLDSATVVKALQAISGEIVLGKLIKTLMRIAVEHAGAERGLLFLLSDSNLQVEAEAATINGQIEIILKEANTGSSQAAPLSILQYVTRTGKSTILEDASVRNLFSDDEYLRRRHPRSVLCMPIARYDEVVGILYLENNLTTHAFTSYRIQVLELVAAQAAISLENARLYTDLRKSEQKLRASEQVTRGQVEALMYSLDVLATDSEPEKFLAKMLSTICRLLNGQSTALWLYYQATESILLRLVVNAMGPLDFDRNRLLIQSPPSWGKNSGFQELLYEGCPILCEDTATDPRVSSEMRDYLSVTGAKKFLAVPILAEGHVRGMISVGHAERPSYQAEEIELAQALAHQVMLAIRLTEVGEQSRKTAVFAERNRMARDVHDTLAQGFTGVIVQLEAAEYAISEGDRQDANRHIRQAGELARRSLSEARRSVHALRPQALEEVNFWQALKGMVKTTTIGTTLQTKFEAKGKMPVLPPAWQENLLRIGQEALSNTLKYARAKQFRTRLTTNAKEFRLELCDDGDGFKVRERHDGAGLAGMRERAEEMGGELNIVSSRGKGTTITVISPRRAGPKSAGQFELTRASTGAGMEPVL